MPFTQLIEIEGSDEQALLDHVTSWHRDQHGTAPGYRGARVFADVDQPSRHVVAVDFDYESEARKNDDRPETTAWAEKLRSLGSVDDDAYRNLNQVGATG